MMSTYYEPFSALNYKKVDVLAALEKAAPKGVDIFIDNTGGDDSGSIMRLITNGGRVCVFGSTSTYTGVSEPKATFLQPVVLIKEFEIRRFLIRNWAYSKWQHSYSELTNWITSGQIQIILDAENLEEVTSFSRHLLSTKNWFSRISWANKKRYILALLEDVRSAWTLSLLLKSLWNCRPKDAVLSVSEKTVWSSYDQVPMDHNRTALPTTILAQVMKSDRLWFLTLDPEDQAMVLSELLIVAGGPVMWTVLRRAQVLYERYRDGQFQNIQECIVLGDQEKSHNTTDKGTKESAHKMAGSAAPPSPAPAAPGEQKLDLGLAQKELEANLAVWNSTIKSLKDNLKLEELEMKFNDGTTRKIWKVNRPKPEVIETVDFFQLFPSAVGKRILSYLPPAQLVECAKINKYWAFLIDDFKADQATIQKIQIDFEKLQDTMLRHDTSLELMEQIGLPLLTSQGNASVALSLKMRPPPSVKASEKSGGLYSMRHFISDKLNKPSLQVHIPLRNLAELTERLEQRGAGDENLWAWCENILKRAKKTDKSDHQEGVLTLGSLHFPCPMMKKCLQVPLVPPLCKDPAIMPPLKKRRNISSSFGSPSPKEQNVKRYSLWTKNFSGLYPVFKVPSYLSPI